MANGRGTGLRLSPTPNDVEDESRQSQFAQAMMTGLSPRQTFQLDNEEAVKTKMAEADEDAAEDIIEVGGVKQEQTKRQIEQTKKTAQALGDTTPDPEDLGEGVTFDKNPNNQTKTEGDLASLLDSVMNRPDLKPQDLEIALMEAQKKEREQIKTMRDQLGFLATRPVGIDLSPLAGLMSDPQRAAIIARTAKPSTSPEEHVSGLLELERALADRKDRFQKTRRELAQALDKNKRDAAVKAFERIGELDEKKTKFLQKERDTFTKDKTIEAIKDAYNSAGDAISMLSNPESFDPNGFFNNALMAELVKFRIAKGAAGPGQLSDQEREAVSESKAILNQIESFVEGKISGVKLTPVDLNNIRIAMGGMLKIKKAQLQELIGKKARQSEKIAPKAFKIKPGDLSQKDQIFDPDGQLSDLPLKSLEEFERLLKANKAGEINIGSDKPEEQMTEAELDAEIKKLTGG